MSFKELEIGEAVGGISKAVDFLGAESQGAKLGRSEVRLWEHVVDVEVLPQVQVRKYE